MFCNSHPSLRNWVLYAFLSPTEQTSSSRITETANRPGRLGKLLRVTQQVRGRARCDLPSVSKEATLSPQPRLLSGALGAAVCNSLKEGVVCSLQDGPH